VLGATFFVAAVVLIGLRAGNTKGEPPAAPSIEITGVAIGDAVNGTAPLAAVNEGETTSPG
jgi:hypothetical protein